MFSGNTAFSISSIFPYIPSTRHPFSKDLKSIISTSESPISLPFCARNEISFAFATRLSQLQSERRRAGDPNSQKYHGFMTLVKQHDEGVLASNSAQAQAKTVLLLTTSLFSSNILELAHSWLSRKNHRISTVCHALLRAFHGLATG